jgi:hypothetical protein
MQPVPENSCSSKVPRSACKKCTLSLAEDARSRFQDLSINVYR